MCIRDRVGGPIGNDEYVLERARVIFHEGGTDHLARCLANMPDKQAAALIVTESLEQRTGYLQRTLDAELSLEACRRTDNGAQWAYDKSSDCRVKRRHSRSSRRGSRISG